MKKVLLIMVLLLLPLPSLAYSSVRMSSPVRMSYPVRVSSPVRVSTPARTVSQPKSTTVKTKTSVPQKSVTQKNSTPKIKPYVTRINSQGVRTQVYYSYNPFSWNFFLWMWMFGWFNSQKVVNNTATTTSWK